MTTQPMHKNFNGVRFALIALAIALLSGAFSSRAALTNVSIGGLGFNPPVVTINVNDKVKWTWVTTFHSTTSTNQPPLWDSGLLINAGTTYTNTFTTGGAFGYICTFHGFEGTVLVTAPNVPPSVTITNPASGVTLSAPASLTLAAS